MRAINMSLRRPFNWKIFPILMLYYFAAAWASTPLASVVGVLPQGEAAWIFALRETLTTGLLSIGLGLFLAARLGLGLPFLEGWLEGKPRWSRLRGVSGLALLASLAGILGFALLAIVFTLVVGAMRIDLDPAALASGALPDMAAWEWLLAAFYGAAEEIPFRLGLLTLFAWLGGAVSRDAHGRPSITAFWIANFLAAVAFGLAHLFGGIPYPDMPVFQVQIVAQNALIGLIMGWLYWHWGLESAMLAHFLVDFWFYVILTPTLKAGNGLILLIVLLVMVLAALWARRAIIRDQAVYPPAVGSHHKRWRWVMEVITALALFVFSILLAGLVGRDEPILTQNPRGTPTMEVDTSTSAANISEMDGMTLFYIPAGEFEMGSANGDPDERPPHTVYLEAFWIDQTEVTNGMYVRCVEAGACTLPSQKNSRTRLQYYGNPAYEDYPVIYVNWQQANAYCAWAGRRLPTEAQWEKAARGVDGRRFPWGNATPQTTWLNWNGEIGDTSTVGSYLEGASPYGALDMLGNVLEWVSDCYDRSYYRRSPRDNPVGPATCRHAHRVIRGGVSWADTPHGHIDLTNRLNHMENAAIDELGFRCALVP